MKVNRTKALNLILGALMLVGQANAYEVYSPKKGVGAGSLARIEMLNASWYYNWNIQRVSGVDPAIEYVPMKHGKNWRHESALADIGEFDYFLGYNEPESASQGDITVAEAINQWPNIVAAVEMYGNPGAQMGSPVTTNPPSGDPLQKEYWIIDFMQQAEANNLRVDFMVMHKYPKPDNSGSMINGAEWYHNTYNKDVWITEFNAADWSGTGNYTHEQSYTWLVEVLYRMESLDYIKRYAIFPWSDQYTASSPSGVFVADELGNRIPELTPLGKLYAEYRSSDINGPYEQVWYHLHNRGSRMRLHDTAGTPSMASVYTEGSPAEFELVSAGSGNYYIVNQGSGKRLGSNGTTTYWTNPGTTGNSVLWKLTPNTFNWLLISHVGSGKFLYGENTGNTGLSAVGSSDTLKWTFIRTGTPYGLASNDAPTFLVDPLRMPFAKDGLAHSGTVAGNARDADNDQLSYAVVSGPAWLSIAPDGTLSGTPGSADVGENTWTISVSDGIDRISGPDTATLKIQVREAGWKGFPVYSNVYTNTDSFIGWIWVGDENSPNDWVYTFSLNKWLYIPNDSQLNMTDGGWFFITP